MKVKGFEEHTNEGGGTAAQKMGAVAIPDGGLTSDGKNLTIKTGSTLKMTQLSCNRGKKFKETTADGRKTQTACKFINSTLIQRQEGDGKKSTVTRKLEDGK